LRARASEAVARASEGAAEECRNDERNPPSDPRLFPEWAWVAQGGTNESASRARCARATSKKWVKLRSSMSWPELRPLASRSSRMWR